MTEIKPINGKEPSGSSVPRDLRFIRGVYWLLVVCGLLLYVGMLADLERANISSFAETTFTMAINLLILYGLQKKKGWVVSVILIFSAWTLLSNFLRVVGESAATGTMMKQKVASFVIALFSIYQLHVFRKKETKLYYGHKGNIFY